MNTFDINETKNISFHDNMNFDPDCIDLDPLRVKTNEQDTFSS